MLGEGGEVSPYRGWSVNMVLNVHRNHKAY